MEALIKSVANFVKLTKGKNIIFVRHGECMANHSGVLAGFTDSPLTIKGREQAHSLYRAFYNNIDKFNGIYCSDLSRAIDTAEIALGFPSSGLIKKDARLRELNFGKDEGAHYDSMSEDKKSLINDFVYQAPGGESWQDAKSRVSSVVKELDNPGNYLVFGHGGVMCSLTWDIGIRDCLPNGSVIGIEFNSSTNQPEKLIFQWSYPKPAAMEELSPKL